MSKAIFDLKAEVREDLGKGASRRLRRDHNKVPAVIYGGNQKPTAIVLDHNKVLQAIEHEAFYSHILDLDVAGKKQKVVLKDLQRHHYRRAVMHMDFQRVKASDVITMRVPIHFINEDVCPGAKAGGIISHQVIDLEVRCKASDLPEFIEVDLAKLELDQAIHLSDLTLPKGVELASLIHGNDLSVVNVHASKQPKADEEAPVSAEGDAEGEKTEEAKSESK